MKQYKALAISVFLWIAIGFSVLSGTVDVDTHDFCIWGINCGVAEYTLAEIPEEFRDYSYNNEGIVTDFPYKDNKDDFFYSLKKVIDRDKEEYGDIISSISVGDSFEEIHYSYIEIFRKEYTTVLDHLSPDRDYIQNIDELISNGYKGDCDDYALLLYLIAEERGLEVRYAIGLSDVAGHAWIEILDGDTWMQYGSTSHRICHDCVSEEYNEMYYFYGDKDE